MAKITSLKINGTDYELSSEIGKDKIVEVAGVNVYHPELPNVQADKQTGSFDGVAVVSSYMPDDKMVLLGEREGSIYFRKFDDDERPCLVVDADQSLDGLSSSVHFGRARIRGVNDPIDDDYVANKRYVDTKISEVSSPAELIDVTFTPDSGGIVDSILDSKLYKTKDPSGFYRIYGRIWVNLNTGELDAMGDSSYNLLRSNGDFEDIVLDSYGGSDALSFNVYYGDGRRWIGTAVWADIFVTLYLYQSFAGSRSTLYLVPTDIMLQS